MDRPDGLVTLVSSDAHEFQVEEEVATMSKTIESLIADVGTKETIPLPNVSGKILAKVLEFMKFHVTSEKERKKIEKEREKIEKSEEKIQESITAAIARVETSMRSFDEEFIKVDQSTQFDLLLAANYLNIKSLLNLLCDVVAAKIRGKSPEEIRTIFNIKNDFTPEEEAEVRRENQWAFE